MADDPFEPSLYREQYEEARKHFDSEKKKCIELVKSNLTDHTIPPYYKMRNCILIVSAMDDWNIADLYRQDAEIQYRVSHHKATEMEDEDSLEILEELRYELDQLKQMLDDDIAKDADNETDSSDFEMEYEGEEAEAENAFGFENTYIGTCDVADAENELEVEAEKIVLPIHPKPKPELKPEPEKRRSNITASVKSIEKFKPLTPTRPVLTTPSYARGTAASVGRSSGRAVMQGGASLQRGLGLSPTRDEQPRGKSPKRRGNVTNIDWQSPNKAKDA
ncbi:unnamed protein product [Periconia digitata]|uniref:Uncharacterized protein n=1 Tax=Periconia digitata TaxID=1303443 RepID=A0A9W4ULA3_9PLEO|nr:unnamed protein product [Periconia digitata]